MPRAIPLLILLMLSLAAGCATTEPRQATADVNRLRDDGRQTRLLSVAKRFEPYVPVGSCRYEISDDPNAGAFAWPDGRILVTSGLIDLLDDEELAAAVAHELGHLLADGHIAGRFSLHGAASPQDVEAGADAIGCQLLTQAGMSPAAMMNMLAKLADAPGLTRCQRTAVRERIRQSSLAQPPPHHVKSNSRPI